MSIVLTIDEAPAIGDIFFQQRCYGFLRGPLADVTKIIFSHDPVQPAALCSRLLILHGLFGSGLLALRHRRLPSDSPTDENT